MGAETSSKIPADLEGEELDRYIAGVIAAEAKVGQSSSSKGPAAASSVESSSRPATATNKTFLSNLIRSTEGHNQAVIRQLKREADRGQAKRAAQSSVREEGARHTDHRHRNVASGSRSGSRRPLLISEDGKRGRMRGFSDDEDEERISFDDPRGPKHPNQERRKARPSEPPEYSSKMDRYFEPDYDPRLDFDEVTVQDATDPKTGLISDAGWDRMLDVLREREDAKAQIRREEKAKRRLRHSHEKYSLGRQSDEDSEQDSSRRRHKHREHEGEDRSKRRHRRGEKDDTERSRSHRHRSSRHRSRSASPKRSRSRSPERSSRKRDRTPEPSSSKGHLRKEKKEPKSRAEQDARERDSAILGLQYPKVREWDKHKIPFDE